jgi:hypothetical protein
MAVLQGSNYDPIRDTFAARITADVTEARFAKISSAAAGSPALVVEGTAGAVPYGVFQDSVDYSVEGGRITLIRNGYVKMTAAAAITDANIPLKIGANGNPTPCDTDKDVIAGTPMHTAASGESVLVDLKLMGSFYTV